MKKVRSVIFDWAGTTVDYGCFAPVNAFIAGFNKIGIEITQEMARKPMGLLKIDHIRAIAAMFPQPISEEEIQQAYKAFEKAFFEDIENHCDIKDYVKETVTELRDRGIKIGSTTGYTSAMMKKVVPAAAVQGYLPDYYIAPDQTEKGRPYPYMIWHNLMRFGISDPREAVKIGDTMTDIEEGKNADCWTVGVIMGSSELGLSRNEVASMPSEKLQEEKRRVRASYYKAGADYIIDDLNELISVIEDINLKLSRNERRKLLTPGPLTTKQSVKHAMLTDHCTWDDEYKAITASVIKDITNISADDNYATVLFQGSGSYAVESMINCLTKPDEEILFLVNGEYGKRMLTIAGNSGRTFSSITFNETNPIDLDELDKRLNEDDDIKTVVFVHCETTTGVINPLDAIVKTAKRHGKKVLVDAISSFGAYDIDMPGLDLDALASSANKCLESLPGLSFVIAKKDAIEKSKGNSFSHSLDLYDQYMGLYEGNGKFRFTSPTNILLALRQALDEFFKEGGLEARRKRYIENHRVLTDGLQKIGILPIVAQKHQSYIITTFELGNMDFKKLYNMLKAEGFIIYPGKLTSIPTFRLGNIGDVYPEDMESLVKTIETYIKAINKESNCDNVNKQQ